MAAAWVYALAWSALALVFATSFVMSGASPFQALRGVVASIVPNALLGIVTLRMARRFLASDDGRGLMRAALAALGVALLATASWIGLAGLDSWLSGESFRVPPPNIQMWQAILNGLVHLALTGVGYAWLGAEETRLARERADRAEALRARAELHLLRTQLNPHFVLNTLHALLGLVRRDPAVAESAIERLGELLQFGLSVTQRGIDRVALREEWAFVTSYLEVEQVRLGERLRFDLDIDPAALDVPIPPFALQPLVENAVTHAIAPRTSGGRLRVAAHRTAGRLYLEVRDDGPGASEANLLASPRTGLRLLRERLAVLYAGEARLSFAEAPGGGLVVRLDVPDSGPQEAA
jgi:two-component system LytT family sensor kinase